MRILLSLLALLLVLVLAGAGGGLYVFYRYGRDLPDYTQLADYRPPTVTRVHAGDGRLLAEYATEKRVFVPIEAIPRRVVQAFLSAEDKNFYSHPGIDLPSIVRAAITNLSNLGEDKRPVGASTITQQVAKNFLLSNEVSLERKIREAILAFRMEHAYPKDRVLELYLNEIYLGMGSYGVAAAALNYFNKSLDELTIAEAAYLAALPKAPNNYHPVREHAAALARRNWVIGRMLQDGRITAEQAAAAREAPLETRRRDRTETVEAPYFAEEVRREIVERYGERTLYGGGLSVRTTVSPELQGYAEAALRYGLTHYDRRHGWRGGLGKVNLDNAAWPARLEAIEPPEGTPKAWRKAAVVEVGRQAAVVGFADGARGRIPMAEMAWARKHLSGQRYGAKPEHPSDVLAPGDVVLVEPLPEAEGPAYALRQMPEVSGAVVVLDPHTGRVLAMSGGFSIERSEFNRATQARRQPGSAFKPFVYLTALENGFKPTTIVLDAPFVIDQGAGLGKWKPANYSQEFYGPTPMRTGIEKSRNLMTVRLAQTVGMEKVAATAERFGVVDDMPARLAMALGAGETTLLRLTAAYGMLVNGGKRIEPTLIDRVQDRHGETVFRHDDRPCPKCRGVAWVGQPPPEIPDTRERLTDAASAYQVVSMLQGVVARGTGRRLASINKPLAGKTGTTNDSMDTWFIGMTPDLVAGAFVGFDEPETLGPYDYGSNVAAPVVKAFMEKALAGEPAIPFRIPPGIHLVRVDLDSGEPAAPGDDNVILEAFKKGQVPSGEPLVIDGGRPGASGAGAAAGTGGLY